MDVLALLAAHAPRLSVTLVTKLPIYIELKNAIALLDEEAPELLPLVKAIQANDWAAVKRIGFIGTDTED